MKLYYSAYETGQGTKLKTFTALEGIKGISIKVGTQSISGNRWENEPITHRIIRFETLIDFKDLDWKVVREFIRVVFEKND